MRIYESNWDCQTNDVGAGCNSHEIRRTLRIRRRSKSLLTWNKLLKSILIGELGDFAKEYVESLHQTVGHISCVADKDAIVAVAGGAKKEFLDKAISSDLEHVIEMKKTVVANRGEEGKIYGIVDHEEDQAKYSSQVIAPIVAEGDAIGAVILLSKEPNVSMGEMEMKIAETAAGFLGKQMEQ